MADSTSSAASSGFSWTPHLFEATLQSTYDVALPGLCSLFAYQYRWVIAPTLTIGTISFFATRLFVHIAHSIAKDSTYPYALPDKYKKICDTGKEHLKDVCKRFPYLPHVIYLACALFAYVHMPTSLVLATVCGVSLGLLIPVDTNQAPPHKEEPNKKES